MGSHTATGDWKSFEYRMRCRRAERLLLRADVEADAGLYDEARACLEEARALAPSLPGLAEIEYKLDHPEASASPSVPSRWAAVRRVALVLTVVAVAAGTAIFAVRVRGGEPAIAAAHDFRHLTLAIDDAGARQPAAHPLDVSSAPSPAAEAERATLDREEVREPRDSREPTAAPLPELRTVSAPMVPDAPIGHIDPPPPAAVPASLDVEDGLPGATAGTAVTVPVSGTPSPAVNAESSDAAVRRTLDRYADAYSALDAAAAARVWPSVNRGALTRAFDGLASQQISLGTCRVDVRGGVAHADCAGSATWAPKVGASSARTEPRRWTFELARRGADWQIVDARVQNR